MMMKFFEEDKTISAVPKRHCYYTVTSLIIPRILESTEALERIQGTLEKNMDAGIA